MKLGISRFRRAAIGVLAALTGTLGAAALVPTAAHADPSFTLTRIAGADRFATAGLFDAAAFPNGSTSVYLADGMPGHEVDALASSGWGGVNGYGALLTDNTNTVPSNTTAALSNNKVKNVVIVGGPSAVSAAQQSALTSAGYTVTRIGGATRYDTMQMLDDSIPAASVGKDGSGNPTGILASGDDAHFVDALSGGGLAYGAKFPVILTSSTSTTLAPQAQEVITKLGITHLIVVGGIAAVPASQYTPAPSGVTKVDVEAGADRSSTSMTLADFAIGQGWEKNSHMELARGDDGADALASAPYAGTQDTWPTCVTLSPSDPGSCDNFASEHAATLTGNSTAAGGPVALTDTLLATVQTAGRAGGVPQTSLPQLVSAKILSTTPASSATTGNEAGTVITYTFDQTLANATIVPGDFFVYDFDGSTVYSGAGQCGITSGCPTPTDPNSVNILFSDAALQTTTGSPSASTLTLATVASGAVTNANGTNPDGAAPIGSASQTTLTAGTTLAPDPESIGTPRAASPSFPSSSAIDVTFDQAAFDQTAAATETTGFDIVYSASAGSTEAACTAPGSTNSTTGSNLTVPGNNGTKTLTIVCPNAPGSTGSTLTLSQISRIVVQPGAVGDDAAGTNTNPLEVTDSPHASNLPNPSLTKVEIHPGTSGNPDIAVFTFDQPVTAVDATSFKVYDSNTATHTGAGVCSTSAITGAGQCQLNSTSTQVALSFANGALASSVGGNVIAGDVENANNTSATNNDDELGATNPNSTTVTPGTINAPQLKSTAVSTNAGIFGSTPVATYTFTQPLDLINTGNLHLYDQDGVELTCDAATEGTGTAVNTVTCTSFHQEVGGSAATPAQLAGAVLATADYDAVEGSTADGAPDSNSNPEGASGVTHS